MRIGLALILITDLCIRVFSIKAHYTNEGVLPLEAMYRFSWNPNYFSLHALNGGLMWQIVLFTLAFMAALGILLGCYTRLATFVSWLLLLSLHNRNGLILQGGDDLLRLLLFWGIFLPWNKRYAIDAMSKEKSGNNSYVGIPALGYALLIFSLYFFSALLKDSDEWNYDGSALYYALSLDQMALPLGKCLYPHASLLQILTFIVYYLELIAPIFLLMPLCNSIFRCIAIFSIIALHLGISLTLFVGLFFLIGMVSAIGLLPSVVMDKMEAYFRSLKLPIKLPILFKNDHSLVHRITKRVEANYYFRLSLNSLLLFIVCFELLWCIGGLPSSHYGVSKTFRMMAYALRLDQNWSMFAPTVLKDDGWYIYEGICETGEHVDINRNGKPVDFSKPDYVPEYIDNDRWRKYGECYMLASNSGIRPYLCHYLLKKWNSGHPDKKLKHLQVIYMKEITEPDYLPVEAQKEILSSCPATGSN